MTPQRRAKVQTIFSLGVICVCVLFIIDSFNYHPALREPLGAAFIPRYSAIITLLLASCLAWKSQKALRTAETEASSDEQSVQDRAWRRRFVGAILTMAGYAALLKWPVLPSLIITPLFLFIFILLLGSRTKKAIWTAFIIAMTFGISLHLLFRDVLYVNLP